MPNAITNSEQIVPLRGSKTNRKDFIIKFKNYLPVVAGVIVFTLLILSSMNHGNLFLSELLMSAFIVLFVLILRASESKGVTHSNRNNTNL